MKFKMKKEGMLDTIKWVTNRKKKTKVLIAFGMVVVLAAGGIYGFGIKGKKQAAAEEAPILEAQVQTGSLSTTIEGTGTLTNGNSADVEIPTGVEIKKVKVSVGDEVKKGDTLATVDAVSLSAALLSTQEELEDINSQINDEADNDTTQYVTSSVDGRIKKIYAKKNTDVGTTILDKGALILISMDGKMAVDIDTSVSVKVGDEVTVTLKDESTVTGTVVKAGDDSCTVTVTDNGSGYNEKVTVSTSDGETVGTGKLYINKESKVTATSGTVKKILVSENEKISEGDSLLKLKGDFQTSAYLSLETEKEHLEEKLESLLKIAQNNTITADSDGIVTAVNVTDSTTAGEESGSSESGSDSTGNIQTSSDTKVSAASILKVSARKTQAASAEKFQSVSTVKDTSSSVTDSQTSSETESGEAAASVTTAAQTESSTSASTSTQAEANTENTGSSSQSDSATSSNKDSQTTEDTNQNREITVISSLSEPGLAAPEAGNTPVTSLSGTGYQGTVSWSPADTTFKADTAYTAKITLTAQKGYSFSDSPSIKIQNASISDVKVSGDGEENMLTFTAAFSKTISEASSSQAGDTTQTAGGKSSSAGGGSMSGSGGSSGSGNVSGSGSQTSTSSSSTGTSTSSSSSDNTELTTAFCLASGDSMTLSVNVDELDILSVSLGQKAKVALDAVENQEFEGEITGIDKNGTSNGGVTKYAVEITVPKEDTMLSGMNASATIIISEAADVLLVPAQAITEEGNTSYVYTKKDESTGELSGKTEVETGSTDGENIEITNGLSEGDTVYYQMISMETSGSEDENGGQKGNEQDGMMGGFGNGGGQGGDRPEGGKDGNAPQGGMGGGNK